VRGAVVGAALSKSANPPKIRRVNPPEVMRVKIMAGKPSRSMAGKIDDDQVIDFLILRLDVAPTCLYGVFDGCNQQEVFGFVDVVYAGNVI
jgi:hypothetical protein